MKMFILVLITSLFAAAQGPVQPPGPAQAMRRGTLANMALITCHQGDLWFATNATVGQNVYAGVGTTPCVWTQQGGSSSAILASLQGGPPAVSMLLNRRYMAIATVTGTIGAALSAITDNSAQKPYLLYVPNGTYNENVVMTGKDYIDLICQSRSAIIASANSSGADTLWTGGVNTLVANCTIQETTNSGTQYYPIHHDSSPSLTYTPKPSSTTIFYNVKAQALGTFAESGIGIGLRCADRLYLIDSTFSSAYLDGVYLHDNTNACPSVAYLVNVTGTGQNDGLDVQNTGGANQGDQVYVYGGAYAGAVTDMSVTNQAGGNGEEWLFTDPNVALAHSTSSYVVPSQHIANWTGVLQVPVPSQQQYQEYTGSIWSARSGLNRCGWDNAGNGSCSAQMTVGNFYNIGTSQLDGNVTFLSDNAFDIGANSATRPRSIYAGTSVYAAAYLGWVGSAYLASLTANTVENHDSTVVGWATSKFGSSLYVPITLGAAGLSPGGYCNSANQGREYWITNSSTQTWGATVSTGSLVAKIGCDGTNWTVIGM